MPRHVSSSRHAGSESIISSTSETETAETEVAETVVEGREAAVRARDEEVKAVVVRARRW